MANGLDASGFLLRVIFSAALVIGTYNPTAYSYFSWLNAEGSAALGPLHALLGMILLIAWIIFLRATFLSLGVLGISLGAALFACVIWLFVDLGWLSMESTNALTWLVLVLVSLILAMGLSWAHIRRRLSGQVSVDDIEE